MINLTPVGEVCDGVVIVMDGVVVCDYGKNGCVVRVFEVGGDE